MLNGVHHVAYVVGDLDRAIRIFEEKFGLKLLDRKRTPEEGYGFDAAVLQAGQVKIELICPYTERSPYWQALQERGDHLHHVAFSTPVPLDEAIKELSARGVKFREQASFQSPVGWWIVNIDPASTGGLVVQLGER